MRGFAGSFSEDLKSELEQVRLPPDLGHGPAADDVPSEQHPGVKYIGAHLSDS